MSDMLRFFSSNEPGDRAKAAEIARVAWCGLPWRARLLLMLYRQWRWLGSWPFFRHWIAWAHVRLFDQALEEQGKATPGGGAPAKPPDAVFLGARGDRLIHNIITVIGIAVILVRHLGHLLLALGALALLTPFLLWPPSWPELRIAYDVARRDAEDDRDKD